MWRSFNYFYVGIQDPSSDHPIILSILKWLLFYRSFYINLCECALVYPSIYHFMSTLLPLCGYLSSHNNSSVCPYVYNPSIYVYVYVYVCRYPGSFKLSFYLPSCGYPSIYTLVSTILSILKWISFYRS